MILKRQTAFTLAEVLITLLIIGIIASIVIPGLIADTQDTEFKTAWKKVFSDFSQAGKLAALNNSGSLSDALGTSTGTEGYFRDALLKHMSYTKLCAENTAAGPDGCWHAANTFYSLSGSAISSDYTSYSRAVLNNGSLVSFNLQSTTCTYTYTANDDSCGVVIIDINSFKGPNKVGKDIYGLHITRNGTAVPFGSQNDAYYDSPSSYSCDLAAYPSTYGWSCSAKNLNQ